MPRHVVRFTNRKAEMCNWWSLTTVRMPLRYISEMLAMNNKQKIDFEFSFAVRMVLFGSSSLLFKKENTVMLIMYKMHL